MAAGRFLDTPSEGLVRKELPPKVGKKYAAARRRLRGKMRVVSPARTRG
jgi:hypothetical protein